MLYALAFASWYARTPAAWIAGVRPSTVDHAAGVPSVSAEIKAGMLDAGSPAERRAGATRAGMVFARRLERMTVYMLRKLV